MHARCTCILFYSKNVIYSNSACMTKSSFVTEKNVHIRVFEIVAHRNVDNWTQQLTWCIWV